MYDVIIAGCGVTGASLAYKLSKYRLKVLVLDKENDVAMGTTKANSAIVHAGYDPEPGTLMAKLNLSGSAQMEELCRTLDVEYRRIGSLVLGFAEADLDTLRTLCHRGLENGVEGMELLTGDQVRAMEPNLSREVKGALLAPSAAIIDPWGLCIAEAETAVRNGVELRLNTAVTGLEDRESSVLVRTTQGTFETRYVVNCTGVHGHELSEMAGSPEWEARPRRGQYYLLDKSSGTLVEHVVFQCPTALGKGVLVSPTVHGNLIVGPTAERVEDGEDRATTLAGLDQVARDSRKSVPAIDLRQSIRNFSGVRAGTNESDFIIRPSRNLPRMLHVAGIKSPGLSAAPAVADYAMEQLADMGLAYVEKEHWDGTRKQVRFRCLSPAEKAALIAEDPSYGRVICRCETITEGEILAAIHSPIPPCSIDGIKRRAGAGMGRCQGGFCGPRVLELLARELGVDPMEITQDGSRTRLLLSRTKGGDRA